MRTFFKNQYGRIYVKDPEHIERVKQIIRSIDPVEWSVMPDDLVTAFTEYPAVVNVGMFCDLDMDVLHARCMSEGIAIFTFNSGQLQTPLSCLPRVTQENKPA